MLVVRLVRRPPLEELLRRAVRVRVVSGVVVIDLVVVLGEDERERCVRGLQVGVTLVVGVPYPIVFECQRLHGAGVAPQRSAAVTTLVDVVTEV